MDKSKPHKEPNEDDDVPQDFFDDFSNPDFMEGLNIVDAWDGQSKDQSEEPTERNKKGKVDEKNKKGKNNRSKETSRNKRKSYSKEKRRPHSKEKRRSHSKEKGRSDSRNRGRRRSKSRSPARNNMGSSTKSEEEKRRDPQKSKRDIENYKVKCDKDKEQKIIVEKLKVVETGLVPPGMEMDVDVAEVMKKANCTELNDTWDEHPNGKPTKTVYPDLKKETAYIEKQKRRGVYPPEKPAKRRTRSRSTEHLRRRHSRSPKNSVESRDKSTRHIRDNRWLSRSPLHERDRRLSPGRERRLSPGRERRLSSGRERRLSSERGRRENSYKGMLERDRPRLSGSHEREKERRRSRSIDRRWSDSRNTRSPLRHRKSPESEREAWLRDSKRRTPDSEREAWLRDPKRRSPASEREAWLRDPKRAWRRGRTKSRSRSRSRENNRKQRSNDKISFLEEIKQLLNNPQPKNHVNLVTPHHFPPPPLPVPPPSNNQQFEYDQNFFIGDNAFNFNKPTIQSEHPMNMQPVHLGGPPPQPPHMNSHPPLINNVGQIHPSLINNPGQIRPPLQNMHLGIAPPMGGPIQSPLYHPPMPSQFSPVTQPPHLPLQLNVAPNQMIHSQNNQQMYSPGTFNILPSHSAINKSVPPPVQNNEEKLNKDEPNRLAITLSLDKTIAKKEVTELFEDKKITLSDFLTISSKIEDSAAPSVNLSKKIQVISRCQDIIKILGEDKLVNGRLKIKASPKKVPLEEQFKSPLRRKPAVRYMFTTPNTKVKKDTFYTILNNLLVENGIIETINLDEDDEINLEPPSPPVISKPIIQAKVNSLKPSKFLMKMVQTEPYKCELCDVRNKKVFVNTGTQCDIPMKSVGVQAPEPTCVEDILKNKSLASLTPAQLLMKEKDSSHNSSPQKFSFTSEWRTRFSPPPGRRSTDEFPFGNTQPRGFYGNNRPSDNFFRR